MVKGRGKGVDDLPLSWHHQWQHHCGQEPIPSPSCRRAKEPLLWEGKQQGPGQHWREGREGGRHASHSCPYPSHAMEKGGGGGNLSMLGKSSPSTPPIAKLDGVIPNKK